MTLDAGTFFLVADFATGLTGAFFFLTSSFFCAESELELVLETRALEPFLATTVAFGDEASELSESELLESLSEEEDDELSLLDEEVVASDELICSPN